MDYTCSRIDKDGNEIPIFTKGGGSQIYTEKSIKLKK